MVISTKDFEIIKDAFTYYNQLIGEPIIYVYRKSNNKYDALKVDYRKTNFMHLCGVTYNHNKRPNASEFYNAIEKNALDLSKVEKKPDGTTNQKLQVIKDIRHLNTCNINILDDKITLLKSSFDKSIKRKNLLLVGLKQTGGFYVPQSIFNIRSKKLKSKQCKIVAVFKGKICEETIVDSKAEFDFSKADEIILQ